MPPNATASVDGSFEPTVLANHFWACDRRGMDQLVGCIRQSYDDLEDIHALYKDRAELEQEFGQKLMALHDKFEKTTNKKTGSYRAITTVHQELAKSAQSHLDMSNRLQDEVAPQLNDWIAHHRETLDKLVTSLDTLYKERQEKLSILLRARDFPKRRDEYQSALMQVNQSVDEWNTTWRNACEELELLEQDRVDFFISNVWDYANLASARLLVQDEWCESIRKQLEECNLQDDLAFYVEHHGTGTKVPSTSDYADYFAEKIVNKQLPPRPRTMSSTTTASLNKPNMSESFKTNSVNVKRKPLGNKDATLNALLKKFERPPIPPVEGRPEITSTSKPTMTAPPPPSSSSSSIKPPKSPRPQAKQLNEQSTIQQQQQQPSRSASSCTTPSSSASSTSSSSLSSQAQLPRSPVMPKEEHSQSRQQTASTTELGSSMQQGPSCMYQQEPQRSPAHHHHHHHSTGAEMPPRSPIQAPAQLQQQQRPASYHQQPQQATDNTAYQQPPRSPIIPPSNPPQQQQQQGLPPPLDMAAVQQQQKQRMMYQQQQQPPRSPVMPPPSPGYTAPRSPIMMAPRSPVQPPSSLDLYQQQQQQPRSPMALHQHQQQPHDILPPTHSPIQPYAVPTSLAPTSMDNTTFDPRWQHQQQASPYMQPATPVVQQQQHDPYAWTTSSNYELPDGKRVLFWVRALYDYNAADPTELSFCKNNLFAVTGMSIDEGWWEAELWDETWHCSRASGCIPHNFMVRI
ncbi:sh3 domain-containing protein [Lichtheimia corymbifera JMRC:FSU:9682]|uniref:Sh3 domain-containing protein n=1 Tax=Lichtheimia corymbifera JMRC:FSU:9682 TaxID=1263082 RepID=A0A068RSK1_9FUNG|nr:sh3 domain-containing protein [Lichtheimia corymbifera JMRC:FSU:9682]